MIVLDVFFTHTYYRFISLPRETFPIEHSNSRFNKQYPLSDSIWRPSHVSNGSPYNNKTMSS